ncbi:MAG: alpha/beta hydrolase family protein, partial [Steroidobacteraceae bacterium]
IKELLRRDEADSPVLKGVLADGSALVLLAPHDGHQAAWALPLDGSPLRLLVGMAGLDVTDLHFDPNTGAVIGVYVGGEENSVRWLDPLVQTHYDSLTRAFPGKFVRPYGWTEDRGRTLVRVSSSSSPPVYYLTDFKTHRADIAAEEYPALGRATLGEVRQITYKARDGTDITAYLTMPPDKPTPVPLVVLPHGGPHDRDYPVFDWRVQFLATRGYAVLQPQFRGSTGFGDHFRDAGDRQWGGLMQDDLTDAVRAIIAQGSVDPHRVCIVGTSGYGGYAALVGAAFTPDLYTCAVSINGVTDLVDLMNREVPDRYRVVASIQSVWNKQIGNPRDAKSPLHAASAVKAPVLIMYGPTPDVPIEQAQAMVRALQRAGKSVQEVALPEGAAWWTRTDIRVQVLQELENFLAKHLQVQTRGDATASL